MLNDFKILDKIQEPELRLYPESQISQIEESVAKHF